MSNCTHSSTTSDPFDCRAPEHESKDNSSGSSSSSTHLDPAEGTLASAIEEGRILGKQEGLLAGFREGRILGQKTGVDYGMEIGFAVGLASAVRNAIDKHERENDNDSSKNKDKDKNKSSHWSSSSSLDRIRKSVDELEAAIDAFPTSETEIRRRLFRSESGADDNNDDNDDNDNDNDNENENEDRDRDPDCQPQQQHDRDPSLPNHRFRARTHPEDVRAKLQRIRARCKVLTAKLGIPRHSLKSVVAEAAGHAAAATMDSREGGGFAGGSREW